MTRLLKTEAIVLRKRQLLGQDVMVTFFTKDQGKLTVIAKGIRKITSRRAPHLQTGNLIGMQLSISHERYYLQSSELISGFLSIKNNPKKTSALYFILFILDRLLPEQQNEEPIYILIKSFLVTLARSELFTPEDLTEYMYRLLSQLGYVQERKSLRELIRFTEEIIHEKIPYHVI